MVTFDLKLFDGHAIILDGDNVILIDTGAPSTIHIADEFLFMNNNYLTSTNLMGMTVESISELLGRDITTLLGADILSNFNVLFDYKNKSVSFSDEEIEFEGNEIPVIFYAGIPVIEMKINNRNLMFYLDSGSKLSYLSGEITKAHESLGKITDFYPFILEFETETYMIETSIGEETFKVDYGNLPDSLSSLLTMGGAEAILGFDFFNQFNVLIDYKNKSLRYLLS